ncbi:hypothetical protein QFZ49_007228 [Streptomyces turgidiscabies]|uniref:Transposase IS116/IS110/IS902 C-terminal domain-containing protein n=1 Tax=Streptomyces turgidiscabies TaxID=85558 RepID=A0ABU0RZ50_9ACTN|nr:hypothetical protein [Streptomyces turgidiscabies]
MNSMFPALERDLDLGDVGPLVLPAGYQTPAAIRRAGSRRLTAWLRNRKVCNAAALAEKVVEAADRQHTAVVGEKATAKMVHTLAKAVMALNEKTAETDKLIEGRFRDHELAEVIESLPGIGTILGAEFLTAVGGSLDAFPTANRLAAFAGVAPAPRDSGQVSGNDHRPTRYHRRLQRVFYIPRWSAFNATPTRENFTIASAPRANATSRLSSHSPAAASTSCGPRSVTDGATRSHPQPQPDARPRLPRRDDRPLRHLGADHRSRRPCHRGLSTGPAPKPTLPPRAVRQSHTQQRDNAVCAVDRPAGRFRRFLPAAAGTPSTIRSMVDPETLERITVPSAGRLRRLTGFS